MSRRRRPPPDDDMFVRHMIDASRQAQRMIAGRSEAELHDDIDFQYSLLYALQIVGEAAWRLSDERKSKHATLEWERIAGFRHHVVHDYFEVDLGIAWLVATTKLQPLIDELTKPTP